MTNNYYKNNKENLQKEARERYQNLSEEKDMLVSDIEIFLKKKKKRSANIVMNDIRVF